MPIQSKATVQIKRPIEEVFRLTNEHVPEWSIVVAAEEVVDDRPKGVGTKFRTITKNQGKEMTFDGVVTQYDPPFVSAVSLTGKHFDIEAEYSFEDLLDRTQVTQRSTVKGKGLTRVFFFLLGSLMNRASCDAAQQEMDSLREYCEGVASQPSDFTT